MQHRVASMVKRKRIRIDAARCNGCGQCVPSCAEGAIQMVEEDV